MAERGTEIEQIRAEIEALSPPDRLRLAAEFLEKKQPKLAYSIAERVVTELGAALALTKLEARRG